MSADLRGLTIATPSGSTSHYQLLYLLGILNLTGTVTVKLAQPSELAELWQNDTIDGAYVWVRIPAPTYRHQVIMEAQQLSPVTVCQYRMPCMSTRTLACMRVHPHAQRSERAVTSYATMSMHTGTNTWGSQANVSEFTDLCQWCCTGRVRAFPLMQPTYLHGID